MKQRNIRQEKGITLIALVITIIVMLILVGVTISIAVNGGLFNYAKKAANETKQAIEDESGIGWVGIIDEYTNSTDIPISPDIKPHSSLMKIVTEGLTINDSPEVDLTNYVGKTWLEWATDPNNTEPFPIDTSSNTPDLKDVIVFFSQSEDNVNCPQISFNRACRFTGIEKVGY